MANALHPRCCRIPRHFLTVAVACFPLLATAPFARAQAVPFVAGATQWVGPAGSAGVIYQGAQSRIWVDADGDALEGAPDTYHSIPAGIDASWTLRLSPTRRIMTATIHSGGSCPHDGTTRIRLYAIPRGSVPMTQLGTERTLNGCLNTTFFFDPDTTAAYRTAVFRETGAVGNNPRYLWWSLVTGTAGTSPSAFLHPTGFVEFAPSGTMAFVQHDVNGASGGGSNYSLMTLCPPTIGQGSQPGFDYTGAGQLRAWYVPALPPAWTTGSRGASAGEAALRRRGSDPLGVAASPTARARRHAGGCAGVWHPGAVREPIVPGATLAVIIDRARLGGRGAPVTYTLTASNSGTLASAGVVTTDRIPTGSVFVSASGGGTFSAATSTVTWKPARSAAASRPSAR